MAAGVGPGAPCWRLQPGGCAHVSRRRGLGAELLGRRWQQARAEVRRVLREAAIDDESFFDGNVVLDIGPGPPGFPDACPGRVSIGVEPLAERFAEHHLLLPDSPTLYLSTGAEHIPLLSRSVDVVLARNSWTTSTVPRRSCAKPSASCAREAR